MKMILLSIGAIVCLLAIGVIGVVGILASPIAATVAGAVVLIGLTQKARRE